MRITALCILCGLFCASEALRMSRIAVGAQSVHTHRAQAWPEYMVEFRGTAGLAGFRWAELSDAAESLGLGRLCEDEATPVVSDSSNPPLPLCCYVRFPSDAAVRAVASRCGTVRRIMRVWGEGTNLSELCESLSANCDKFADSINAVSTWRVQFHRYGRDSKSGTSAEQKHEILSRIVPVLGTLADKKVNMKNPDLDLLYLEDWSTYQSDLTKSVLLRKAARLTEELNAGSKCISALDENHGIGSMNTEEDSSIFDENEYCPISVMLAEKVAEGPSVAHDFALNSRPFVGTTSMNALCAHLSANAAHVKGGWRVLDPFCGTGSLLIAAAYLGADVVGSDIDGGGLLPPTEAELANVADGKHRSKNVNFRRRDGKTQRGLCVLDNFKHYGLQDRVLGLHEGSVHMWLEADSKSRIACTQVINKFDAIITDPPFGRRETPQHFCTGDSASHPDFDLFSAGSPTGVLATLCKVALDRLKETGKLVFWLPTAADTSQTEVLDFLNRLIVTSTWRGIESDGAISSSAEEEGGRVTGSGDSPWLDVVRVTREILSDSLWRWLCVLERTTI